MNSIGNPISVQNVFDEKFNKLLENAITTVENNKKEIMSHEKAIIIAAVGMPTYVAALME